MKVLAKTTEGYEYMYSIRSAHKVSARSGKLIADNLNELKYELKSGELWHLYDVDEYDEAYYIAQEQSFTIRNGKLIRRGW